MDERPCRSAGAGMDDDARRLVHDEQVLVLVGEAQVERLCDERRRDRRLELDLLARLEPVALRARDAVDAHLAGREQPLGGSTRADLVEPGEEAVEPQPRRVFRDADADQERAAACRAPRSASSSDPSSTPTPTTIDASARLKAGHQRRSRKSVT